MKKIISLLFILSTYSFVDAQSLAEKLKVAFHKFESDEQLTYASSSFTVLNAKSGALIFGGNLNTGLAPASSLKTITSATALALLGEEFKYQTDLLYSGKIENGVLNGNLIIRGNGDPTLGSWRWKTTNKEVVCNQIISALQKANVKMINGKIIADDGLWDSQSLPNGWIWQDIGNYYGAGTSALSWGENQLEIAVLPGKTIGAEVKILNQNSYPFLDIKNEIQTGAAGSGDQVYAYSAPFTGTVYLRGTYAIGLDKKIGISLPDPALAMAYDIAVLLKQNNISFLDYTTSRMDRLTDSDQKLLLTSVVSPPLKEIIYWFNHKSVNLYGEQLLRTLGQKFGKGTSTNDGVKAMLNFWSDKGIDKETLNICDGSGLSPTDRVTTLSMAKVLSYAQKQVWYGTYLESFPTHNDLKMKSGTIGDVLAYAGYANVNGEVPVCFSLMINNYNGSSSALRQKMFVLLNELK